MDIPIPWESVLTQVIIWAVVGVLGWVIGRLTTQTKAEIAEREALYQGVRALLRSEIMRTHHQAVKDGYITTTDREVMQRTVEAYHSLHGNGVATTLYNEAMSLPTREPEWTTDLRKEQR